MARSKKQKHGGEPFVDGKGKVVDAFSGTIPRQAKSAAKRHANRSKAEVRAARRH